MMNRRFLARDLTKVERVRSSALEREQLFRRRSAASASSAVAIDVLAEEGESLRRSTAQVDDIMESGRTIIGSLATQRERLKATHRNALSMINTLGVSNSVMRLIQSREKHDRYIVFAGMALTLLVFYACVRYASSGSSAHRGSVETLHPMGPPPS
mmetsp:Transcript_14616/g.58394  ORF Transcript_14616/g.58394 Transcript_14616/m.58394 type:complete len:156 (-) Transcript_14616:171-638(-)